MQMVSYNLGVPSFISRESSLTWQGSISSRMATEVQVWKRILQLKDRCGFGDDTLHCDNCSTGHILDQLCIVSLQNDFPAGNCPFSLIGGPKTV